MSLTRVEITTDVLWTCIAHAHTSEKEEIMGMLLGNTHYDQGNLYAHLWMALPGTRTDRRKDRVELGPEQLVSFTGIAEKLTQQTGERTKVMGWYHSHPHITVLPSQVDVRTQANQQQQDEGFVGIIVSCFNDDPSTMTQTVKVTAFQSVQFEMGAFQDDQTVFSDADTETQAAIQASMQQHGEHWVRKEVPLVVVESKKENERRLCDLLAISEIVRSEEKKRYDYMIQAALKRTDTSNRQQIQIHDVYFASAYQQNIIRFMDTILLVQLEAIKLKRLQTQFQLGQTQAEMKQLLKDQQEREKRVQDNLLNLDFDSLNTAISLVAAGEQSSRKINKWR
eukprot:TRINITY_DN34518_c0_g1_i1.p1 TRINITY_DN34518_c0_g1~~TRINITY_DN34518_c0_g1_i1.p1  ORF type:complete len:338 (-),score=43.59 TRINITY_DN34518_c0_g1_i1:56-1069(-)